jgi:D-lyxose ketol-isomerase
MEQEPKTVEVHFSHNNVDETKGAKQIGLSPSQSINLDTVVWHTFFT